MSWEMVDEGWGRKAVDFATIAEPSNSREYVFMHSRLGIGPEHHVLDVACGSGLAIELTRMRGARCDGIDASQRLVAVARSRNPDSDIHVGDMHALPWPDDTFDVVTSFRGVWGTTPGAMSDIHRVLRPGGRFSMTVWGDIKKSPGKWAFEPLRWAAAEKIQHQAQMVSLGRPDVGVQFLRDSGFDVEERFLVPFVMEWADPEMYARAIASGGPSYEAMQNIGEEEFLRRATDLARDHMWPGLPLRAELQLFGFIGTKR